jgi:RNA polymerase sigma factor (TIGR02999 family)
MLRSRQGGAGSGLLQKGHRRESASPPVPSGPVSQLLIRWGQGDDAAFEKLFPLVYDELRRLARRCLAGERPDHTLQSTALVHEAYVRLVGYGGERPDDRIHFLAMAAQMMRRILVDHARMRYAAKRGGNCLTLLLDETVAMPQERGINLTALDDALQKLTRFDTQQAQIVEMRFFAGLSIEETSEALGVSPATVKRDWASARAWLYRELQAAER